MCVCVCVCECKGGERRDGRLYKKTQRVPCVVPLVLSRRSRLKGEATGNYKTEAKDRNDKERRRVEAGDSGG